MGYSKVDDLAYLALYVIENTIHPRNLKVQKLIYIYEAEIEQGLLQKDFSADKFGPFSKAVGNTLQILLNNGFVKDETTKYSLTKKGEMMLKKLETSSSISINKEYFKTICTYFYESPSDLVVKYVYTNYNDMLGKSIIIDGLEYEEDEYD